MRFAFLIFLVIPIAELYLLFAVADLIGGLATLLIVIVTACAVQTNACGQGKCQARKLLRRCC
jgi:UPF0716 family protein affecting phage T7 exclusion